MFASFGGADSHLHRDVLTGLISIGELPQPGGSHFTSTGRPTIGTLIGAAFARDAARENWGPIVRGDGSASQEADDLRKDGFSPCYYTHGQTTDSSPAPSSSSNSSQVPATYDAVNGNDNGNSNSNFPMDFSFELPVHTADLGRVPFHHGFSSHFDPRYSISQQQQQQPPFPAQIQQQQQQTFYPDPLQQQNLASTSLPLPLSNGVLGGDGININSFGPFASELSLADYQQLLAAMSVPTAAPSAPGPSAQQIQPQPQPQPQPLEQEQAAAVAGMASADADVSMMFEDNMVEMWSAAPTSLA